MNTVAEKPNREALNLGQQFGELITIVVMFLMFAFFVYHQAANTGFFTTKFGPFEMVCFYGPMLLSAAAPLVRTVTARRNPGRPLEIAVNLFLALGSLWLLNVFPFNFAHLADALPAGIRFLLAWVNNDIGRLVLILQVVVGSLVAIFTTGKYVSVRWREHTPTA